MLVFLLRNDCGRINFLDQGDPIELGICVCVKETGDDSKGLILSCSICVVLDYKDLVVSFTIYN